MKFAFETFQFDADRRILLRDGDLVDVGTQPLDILTLLLEASPAPVSKDELVDKIWGGRAISDDAIFAALKKLRKALGDDGKTQRLVKTFYGRGFAFVGELKPSVPPEAEVSRSPGEQEGKKVGRGGRAKQVVALILATIAAALLWIVSDRADRSDHVKVAVLAFTEAGAPSERGSAAASQAVDLLSLREDFETLPQMRSLAADADGRTLSDVKGQLGADYFVTGNLTINEDIASLDLRLVEGKTERLIWSRTIEAGAEDTQRLGVRAYQAISAGVQAFLEVGAGETSIPPGTSPEVVHTFRKGLDEVLSRLDFRDIWLASTLLDQARREAPDWADAHGLFAYEVAGTSINYRDASVEETAKIVDRAANRALELDPENRWALLAKSKWEMHFGTNIEGAVGRAEAIADREPNLSFAQFNAAHHLIIADRYDEALKYIGRGRDAAPVHLGYADYLLVHALRGAGKHSIIESTARACTYACRQLQRGWIESILAQRPQEKPWVERQVAMVSRHLEATSVDEDERERAIALIRHWHLGAPMPEGPFDIRLYGPLTLGAIGSHSNDKRYLDLMFDYLESDELPPFVMTDVGYDDGLQVDDSVRSTLRYRRLFSSAAMRSYDRYRRDHGNTAGLPIGNIPDR